MKTNPEISASLSELKRSRYKSAEKRFLYYLQLSSINPFTAGKWKMLGPTWQKEFYTFEDDIPVRFVYVVHFHHNSSRVADNYAQY